MLVLTVLAIAAALAGLVTWWVLSRWSPDPGAPQIDPATLDADLRATPHARQWIRRRTDPAELTGLALSVAVVMVVVGFGIFGVLLLVVRTHTSAGEIDLSAARFGANHATSFSTTTLRALTQLGGAVVLIPVAVVLAVIASLRQHAWKSIAGFLAVTIGGQFVVANLVKLAVNRARPDLLRLTGFSSSSFPSGHATASAASFAAIALVFGRGRTRASRSVLGGVAVGLAVAIAGSRVMLGVHWLTDVVAGLSLGWAWFALSSVAFGGRLLRFGAPAEVVATEGAAPDAEVARGPAVAPSRPTRG